MRLKLGEDEQQREIAAEPQLEVEPKLQHMLAKVVLQRMLVEAVLHT